MTTFVRLSTLRALTLCALTLCALLVALVPGVRGELGTNARPDPQDAAAIDAYRKGDLDTAVVLWSAELEANASSRAPAERARRLYNLGNASFRAGRTLEAVGWYTAALRLRPRDGDTWANLEHARSEAKLEPADRGDLSATLRRLFSSLTLAESEWLVVAVAFAWAVVLAGEALRGGRVWRRIAFVGALAVAISLVPLGFSHARESGDPVLVIQADKLPVRSEPRADAAIIAEVASGETLERRDALPDWTKVELASGLAGWVESRSVFALRR